MKTFELSKKASKNGRRHFKAILHEIYPDSCVDEKNGVGTEYNENGLTWIREYCEKWLHTIKGMSLRCEFLDEERTCLNGHGETDIKDGLPLFEDAVMIGTFEKGYIEDIETEDGIKKTVCVGEGTIDGLCYHNFCEELEKDLEDGNAPKGSVEILKTGDNPAIVYKYGFKERGRIPMEFEYSGYAILGLRPADQTAQILELNNVNKEDITMGETEIKAIVSQVMSEMNSSADEIKAMKEECEKQIAEAQSYASELQAEIDRLNEHVAELESKANALSEANEALTSEKASLTTEISELKTNLEEAQKKEKVGELNEAIKEFTDEQKAYAQAEIDAFNESPLTSEINSVVEKIHAEIGKKYIEEVKKASEEKEEVEVEDIFSEINEAKKVDSDEDVDIF